SAGDIWRRAMDRLKHARSRIIEVEVCAGGNTEPSRNHRPKVGNNVTNQGVGDDHVETYWSKREVKTHGIHMHIVSAQLRIPGTALLHDLLPQSPRLHEYVCLVAEGELLSTGLRELERKLDHPLDPGPRVQRLLHRDGVRCASVHRRTGTH